MIHNELASDSSEVSPHAVMPCPPRMQPTDCGLASLIAAMSRPSWKPGRRQGTHTTLSPKISLVSASPSAAVAIAMPRVGVQVVDVRGVDQPVHGGVDRRRGTALAVQAVVERRDHLVLTVDARVDVDQRAHPVQPQHRQPGLGQGAEVTAGALDPDQLDVLTGHRVGLGALRGGVAAGVVGVLRVAAEPVRSLDEAATAQLTGLVISSILPGSRRHGRSRSASGSRSRRRRASGCRAARAPRARRRGRRARRCRRRP